MPDRTKQSKQPMEVVEPLGKRVLIRKDEDKKVTKGGIELPDSIEIPTITGRVVTVSAQIDNDDDFPIRQYDRVLFNPKHAIPVEFEPDNCLYVVPIEGRRGGLPQGNDIAKARGPDVARPPEYSHYRRRR